MATRRQRISMVLAVAGMVSVVPMRAALADHDDDRGRYEQQRRGHAGHPGNRGGRRQQQARHGHDYQRYPVYAPPPVYYPREASPGITLFFPFEIR